MSEDVLHPSALLAVATCRIAPTVWRLRGGDPGAGSGDAAAVRSYLEGFGFHVASVDLSGAHDKATLLDTVLAAIDAPDWAGRNWDALLDVLVDRFTPEDTSALLLAGADGLVAAAPEVARTLAEVLGDVAAEHQSRGRVFYALWLEAGPGEVAVVEDVL